MNDIKLKEFLKYSDHMKFLDIKKAKNVHQQAFYKNKLFECK